MTLQTVPCDSLGVLVTVTAGLTHLCPFKDEVDDGTVTVSWRVGTRTIELHSLRAFFDSFTEAKVSHEELTNHIRSELGALPGLRVTSTATSFTTAGMAVEALAGIGA